MDLPLIRPCECGDFEQIADIFNHYIRSSISTMALEPTCARSLQEQWESPDSRLWLVAEFKGRILGYACAKSYKPRGGYQNSLETTIYLAAGQTSKGYGRPLYRTLLQHESVQEAHCLLAGISLPNDASVRLHESLGFQKVAHLPEVGRKFGRWIDVGYWHKLLTLEPAS